MSCSYCSVENCDKLSKMSLKTVDEIFERATSFCKLDKTIFLIWHGGEPLLMGHEFFEYIGQKTEEYDDFKIINTIQSNATLINKNFIDIILRYNFNFGTSIDGTAKIHDMSRKDKQGNSTFNMTMKSLDILKSKGVNAGAILVLNKLNIGHLTEIYRFFNLNGINFRVNPVLYHGKAAKDYDNISISPREYGLAMINLFDIWYNDPESYVKIDPFQTIMGNIITGQNRCCEFRKQCHSEVVSIGPNGNVYPCGQFNGNEDFYLGNIQSQGFEEILSSMSMKTLLMRTPENITRCKKCKYAELCNCGCTASAVCINGDIMEPDYYCIGRKMIFKHIIEAIKKDIKKANISKNSS